MNTKLVKEYMTVATQLIKFRPETDIFFAIDTLINRTISGAPVVNDKGDLVGILSEKDCLKVLIDMSMHELPGATVEQYMSKEAVTLNATTSIMDAVELFQKNVFRRFPVVEGAKLVGLLTRRDILRAVKDIRDRK
jgi:CBS domain-containing protein